MCFEIIYGAERGQATEVERHNFHLGVFEMARASVVCCGA
jgi:hypothetical protein